jgi:cysteine synthase
MKANHSTIRIGNRDRNYMQEANTRDRDAFTAYLVWTAGEIQADADAELDAMVAAIRAGGILYTV